MGALTDAIDAYNAAKAKKVPQPILDTMARCTEDLKSSDVESTALKTGDTIPDFELPNQRGEMRKFSDLLKGGTVVLNVYRGGWCPYCNMEMKALHDALPDIQAKGAQLVGLAPETPDHATDTVARAEMNIEILSDAGNAISERLGLVFELPEPLRPIYESIGIDITAFNGDDSFRLPVPATYIVGSDGVIQYHFVNADYTRRIEPTEIVAALGAH